MSTVESDASPPVLGSLSLRTSWDRAVLFRRTAWSVFAALIAADVAASIINPLGTVGVILWYLSYAYVLAFALFGALDVLRDLVAHREPLLVGVIVVYGAIVVGNLTDPRSLSAEAAHEINCAVQLMTSAPDHGFRGTCLFGYPARQFFLPVVPTLLFGRSQLLLNLGGDLYFLMGVLIFAGGLIRYRQMDTAASLVTALLLTVFLHVYFWSHFILIYEQSIFPLSFALIGGGLLLYYLAGERAALPVGGLVLLYLVEAYTPSLAVFALGVVVLLYLSACGKVSLVSVAVLVLGSALVLVFSYSFRGDLNVGSGSNPALRQDIWHSLEHVIYLNRGVPVTSPVLVWPLLITMVLCLGWQLGIQGFVVGCWAIAVYLIAVVAHGYSLNSLDFRLHRAMIIFPVLITLGAVVSSRFSLARARNALTVVGLVMLVTGLKFHLDYRNAQAPDPSLAFASWLHGHVREQGSASHPIAMWWEPGSDQFLPAVRDVLGYFAPGLQGQVIDASLLAGRCPAATELQGVIVLEAKGPCFVSLRGQTTSSATRFDGYYVDPGGRALAVFARGPTQVP